MKDHYDKRHKTKDLPELEENKKSGLLTCRKKEPLVVNHNMSDHIKWKQTQIKKKSCIVKSLT